MKIHNGTKKKIKLMMGNSSNDEPGLIVVLEPDESNTYNTDCWDSIVIEDSI